MLYSVRMRSAEGGSHEIGGRHISGAERIVAKERVKEVSKVMIERAFSHTRGQADFINIVVDKITEDNIQRAPLLPACTVAGNDVKAGHQEVQVALEAAGVTTVAVRAGMAILLGLPDSMRGAMVLCAVTGRRLDGTKSRGVRVSHMDIEDEVNFVQLLEKQGIHNTHVREAMVLASKVAAAPGIVAELCWSDDPEYTTGYVASPAGYIRIPHCKPMGSAIGGRVFFVKPETSIPLLTEYLEEQAVLITIAEKL